MFSRNFLTPSLMMAGICSSSSLVNFPSTKFEVGILLNISFFIPNFKREYSGDPRALVIDLIPLWPPLPPRCLILIFPNARSTSSCHTETFSTGIL